MAEPILKLTRGVPKNDREWMDVFRNLTKFFRVSGDELQIGGNIALPPASVGTDELEAEAVTNEKLRDSAALSVMGRPLNTGGAPSDIIATVDDTFVVRRGAAITWDALEDGDIPATIARDSDVTDALAAHVAAVDPHPGYLTQTEGDARYAQFATGTYTGTFTGTDTNPTLTIRYSKAGSLVTLYIPETIATSNATSFTITGAPSLIRPARNSSMLAIVQDNGALSFGKAQMQTDGTLVLGVGPGGLAFTASGTKGVELQDITYSLD